MDSKFIYYIFEYNSKMPGVNKKVASKIIELRKVGIPIKALLIYTNENEDLSEYPDIIFEKVYFNAVGKTRKILKNRFLSFINVYSEQKKYFRFIYKKLRTKEFSLVIKRYGNLDISAYWFVRKIKGKIIFELNTIQFEQNKKEWKFRSVLSSPSWISYVLYSELLYGRKCLDKAKAVVAVSKEIADNTIKRLREKERNKVHIVSNGINTNQIDSVTPKWNDELNMLMIRGVDSDWHGVDIVLESMKHSSKKLQLFVVGEVSKEKENPNVIYTGRLNAEEISALIIKNNIHIGLGSMALFRAGLNEASPLKVRDYLSRGLPVVLNYYDTDLSEDESFLKEYCFSFNDEMNLDEVYDWFKNLYFNKKEYVNNIKNWAEKNVGMNVKIKQYADIINNALLE
ncbi:MAG: hypothetical protein KDC84_08185 [Crocinitomicaceae bacterium]|nr:hypothetical protein [Crocinitomicaceae bacterium]